jgi:dipeptidyl aminopeptidase/acylaminoacyl peptidase
MLMRSATQCLLFAGLPVLVLACAEPIREVPQYTIEQFYENMRVSGGSFSHDNSQLLVSSDRSGVFNAYTIPVAGGEMVALTQSTDDAIFAVSYFPNDDRVLYTQDQGGNELSHVYVREGDGSTRDLTPGENLQANFGGWAQDLLSFFVYTNERDQSYFDLYQITADGYQRSLLYENTEGLNPGTISRDERYIALVKAYTTANSDIFLHDRETGVTRNLTEHSGDVSNSPTDFTPDGTGLLFVTDEGSEFAALKRYDLATGEVTDVYSADWDVLGGGYTHSGRYLLVAVNEEARARTRVFDAATMMEVPLSRLPEGLVRGMSISRDDTMLRFYHSDGSAPNDLWAGPLDGAPNRLTNTLSATIAREDLVVPEHVWFTSYDSVQVPGLLYKPHQVSSQSPAPAVVWVHGGPGGQSTFGYFALTQALVNHGYVVYQINNRGSSGYGKTFFKMDDQRHGEADLGDVVASKAMLAATGYVDPERIGIVGGSYGGYMVLAALTLQPDEFKAGVDLFGISNWIRTLESIPPWWGAFRDALLQEMGDPATDEERLRRISPLFNADKITAPLMVLQGANDPRVLQVESDEIVAAAKANGVPVEYIVFPDEGHGFVKKENEIRGYGALIDFLDQHLRGAGTTP